MSVKNLSLIIVLIYLSSCNPKLQKKITLYVPDNPINICIDSSNLRLGPCEPSICINPNDNKIIVAGSILNNVYYSSDSGFNWTKKTLKSPYGVYGDPAIRADNKGNFYYSHLSNPAGDAYKDSSFLDRIVVQKSMDNGENWNNGSFTTPSNHKDQDKQWPTIDMDNNYLYMTWTEFDSYDSKLETDRSRILFAKSIDGATTWTSPKMISDITGDCLDGDNTTEGAVPCVGPYGEIYVAWSLNEKIYFDKSLDQGKTWLSPDIVVANQPGGWEIKIPGIMRCNGMPITAVDLSTSKHNGTIYVNWVDSRNGPNDTDIWISKSTNKGDTWSKPIRVNNDAPGKHQFLTWMSVDPITGFIYIIFYDRRNHDDENTDVYLAYSTDGGTSFTNKKISQQPFKPNKFVFFGDYNDISAYNGMIRPIWTRLDQTKLSIWTAIINTKLNNN